MSPDRGVRKLAMSPDYGAKSWRCPDKDLESWQCVLIAGFSAAHSGHCQLSGLPFRTCCPFAAPNQDSLPLTQTQNWETLPVSGSQKRQHCHFLNLMQYEPQHFHSLFSARKVIMQNSSLCFRTNKSRATSYKKKFPIIGGFR